MVEDGSPGPKGIGNACQEINGFASLEWSVQSPDLNLIEALWADKKTELGESFGKVPYFEVLKVVLNNGWDNIGVDGLDSLIRSMPRSLETVIAAGGNATPY